MVFGEVFSVGGGSVFGWFWGGFGLVVIVFRFCCWFLLLLILRSSADNFCFGFVAPLRLCSKYAKVRSHLTHTDKKSEQRSTRDQKCEASQRLSIAAKQRRAR